MNLAAVMDEIAARVDAITGLRTHAFPPDQVNPPAAVVTYPDEYTFDETFGRGTDRMTLPVVVLVGKVSDRKSRDQLAAYVDGSGLKSVKQALEASFVLNLPGSAGATASTPDHSSFAVTDLDVRVRLSTNWAPGGFGKVIASQWGAEGNQGWIFQLVSSGELLLNFTSDGSTDLTRNSTVATGFAAGSDHWIRVVLDVDNGAAGHDVKFYTSTDGTTWTQLGATVTTAGTTSLFNSTADVVVGDTAAGSGLPVTGQVRQFELRDSIDGIAVGNPNFAAQPPGTTSFVDGAGRTWTVNAPAAIVPAGSSYTAFDSVRVTGATFDIVALAGVEHVAATFTLDIAGKGA